MKLIAHLFSGGSAMVEAHNIAKKVDALIESALGNGICEIHINPKLRK
jgi:hypothetical protein